MNYIQPKRLLCPWDSPGKNWSGLPFPPPGALPDPGITPTSLMSPALAGRFFTVEPQVLKLQLITLSRNKCAGSDVVDIAFFGPHTHTLTHRFPTVHNLPGNSLHCLFSGALWFSLRKSSQWGISAEEEWRQTYIASVRLASEQKDISYETKF